MKHKKDSVVRRGCSVEDVLFEVVRDFSPVSQMNERGTERNIRHLCFILKKSSRG